MPRGRVVYEKSPQAALSPTVAYNVRRRSKRFETAFDLNASTVIVRERFALPLGGMRRLGLILTYPSHGGGRSKLYSNSPFLYPVLYQRG